MKLLTKKRQRKRKRKSNNTRKKRGGINLTRIGTGLLAAASTFSGFGAATPTTTSSTPTTAMARSAFPTTATARSAFPTTAMPKFDFDSDHNTFSGEGDQTQMPSVENNPYNFPQRDTSLASAGVQAGMFLKPKSNYKVTPMAIHNPSFGRLGSVGPLQHHTLQVEELKDDGTPSGKKAHIGYYAGLDNTEEIAKYHKIHSGRPKINDPKSGTLIMGGPGKWMSDPIVEHGLGEGNTLEPVGESATVSGDNFNEIVGKKVNLGNEGTYSAPGGVLKGALQGVVGGETAEEMCGIGNCQTEAARVMEKLKQAEKNDNTTGGKRRKHNKTRKKKKRNKIKKVKKVKKRKTKRIKKKKKNN